MGYQLVGYRLVGAGLAGSRLAGSGWRGPGCDPSVGPLPTILLRQAHPSAIPGWCPGPILDSFCTAQNWFFLEVLLAHPCLPPLSCCPFKIQATDSWEG